jgi:hypothetical protein
MEMHAPGGPVRSLKDFLVHIGVVTLGILIALGLEQLVEAHHRSQLAKTAVASFRKELAYNQGQVTYMQDQISGLQAKMDKAIAQLSSVPTTGAVEPSIVYPGFSLEVVSSAAWDSAVATQALNELPFEAVTRYAQAYATLRVFADMERETLGVWKDLRRFGTDPAALSKDQRSALILELRRYGNSLTVVDFAGRAALRDCGDALK